MIDPGLELTCLRCHEVVSATFAITSKGCQHCSAEAPSNFRANYAIRWNPGAWHASQAPSIWRYTAMLPIATSFRETLGEGLTPLTPVTKLGTLLKVPGLLLKDESRNPTGSHKDRFSAVFVSYARQRGYGTVATASSGNAGASLAAYASKAGMGCVVATTAGGPRAMAAQIETFGATIVPFEDKHDRWRFLAQASRDKGWLIASPFRAPVVGSHPIGIEGYKTLAFEIFEQLGGKVPEWCVLPVCYGDALAGIWQGFKDLKALDVIDRLPRLIAAEAYGSLAQTIIDGGDKLVSMPRDFETTAVSIGATQSSFQALNAVRESGGIACPVTNDELAAMQSQLARSEGVFAELSSVAALAAIGKLSERGQFSKNDTIVAITTSSGLKDLEFGGSAAKRRIPFASPKSAWDALENSAIG